MLIAFSTSSNEIQLISKNISGSAAGSSSLGGMSADGEIILFNSLSSEIVPDDNNTLEIGYRLYIGWDAFTFDSTSKEITRISLNSQGGELKESESGGSSISPDGRYVAFTSSAFDVVSGVTTYPGIGLAYYHGTNVFLLDQASNQLDWISKSPDNYESTNSGSGHVTSNGDVFFHSTANNLLVTNLPGFIENTGKLYKWNHDSNLMELVSVDSNDNPIKLTEQFPGFRFDVNADANYIVFCSEDEQFSPDGIIQVVLKNLETNELRVVSRSSSGNLANRDCELPQISGNGRYIVFTSKATNLTDQDPHPFVHINDQVTYGSDVFIYDRLNDSLRIIPIPVGSDISIQTNVSFAGINYTGNLVAFLGNDSDTGRFVDLFLYNQESSTNESLHSTQTLLSPVAGTVGIEGIPILSEIGTKILFQTNEDLIVPEDTNSSHDIYMITLDKQSSVTGWELNE